MNTEQELKPNTDSYREREAEKKTSSEEKRVTQKVVTGKVVKKSKLRKLAGEFLADDISNINENLYKEVLIPKVKKFMADSLDACIDVIFYGEKGRPRERTSGSRYSYSQQYNDRRKEREDTRRPVASRRSYDYRDITVRSRREAEDVIVCLEDIINRYGIASVRDFYDACDLDSEYTDCKYGWTDVSKAEIIPTRNGEYLIKLPTAIPID